MGRSPVEADRDGDCAIAEIRYEHVYDPGGGRLILFGGRERLANIGDTWGYDGLAWTRIDTAGPSPRNGHAMVYDPRAKAILLFGGRNAPAYFNDLWAFDGGWRQIPQR